MKKPKPIPTFKTLAEEAEFWNTHSFADYWDKTSRVNLIYEPEPKKVVVHIKLSESLKKQIERIARAKDTSMSSLLRMWTVEKLNQFTTPKISKTTSSHI